MRRVIAVLYIIASALAEEKSSARNARQTILISVPQLYSYQHTGLHPSQYSSYPYGGQYDHTYVPGTVPIQYQPLGYDNIPSPQSLNRETPVIPYHHNLVGTYFNSESYPRNQPTSARGSGSSSNGLQMNNALELPFSYYNVASYFPRRGYQNTNRNDVTSLTQTASLAPQTFPTTPSQLLPDSYVDYRERNSQASGQSISRQSAISGTNNSRLSDFRSQSPSGLHNIPTRRPASYRVVEA